MSRMSLIALYDKNRHFSQIGKFYFFSYSDGLAFTRYILASKIPGINTTKGHYVAEVLPVLPGPMSGCGTLSAVL